MTDEPEQKMFIVDRPMYRVIVYIEGNNIDVDIVLTAKGKRYARGRARGFHHVIHDEDEALTEIIHARDNYYPTPLKVGSNSKFSFDV